MTVFVLIYLFCRLELRTNFNDNQIVMDYEIIGVVFLFLVSVGLIGLVLLIIHLLACLRKRANRWLIWFIILAWYVYIGYCCYVGIRNIYYSTKSDDGKYAIFPISPELAEDTYSTYRNMYIIAWVSVIILGVMFIIG